MALPTPSGPPVATTQPFSHTEHGVERPDPYHWLREVDSDRVVGHLGAERSWYDSATAHLHHLVRGLHAEMTARTPPADWSVSWRHGSFSYYSRVPTGREHTQLVRDLHPPEHRNQSSEGASATESVLLDLEQEAAGSAYAELGLTAVSPDDRYLAWSVDLTGDEVYRLRFRDLETGRDLDEVVPRSYYGGAWAHDRQGDLHFFYTVHDAAYRPCEIRRHRLGTPVSHDVVVLVETDERFELGVRATRSGALVVIWAESRDTRETWVLPTDDALAPPRSVGGRRAGVEYHAEHLLVGSTGAQAGEAGEAGTLVVVTNDGAEEFRLTTAPVPRDADQDHTSWVDARPEDPAVRIERAEAFADHVVLRVRTEGERRLLVLPADDLGDPGWTIAPAFPTGTLDLAANEVYESPVVVVCDQSLIEPPVWTEVDLNTGVRVERRRAEAPGHDPAGYVAERHTFAAPDGTSVGATVVRSRQTPLDGTAPCLIYGYGAYEYVFEAEWEAALPSLLDRGVVYVHAHIRGGGEGGRRWWLEGRMAAKQHTFDDHLAVADGLAAGALVDPDRLASRGLSAGGLLQGAVFSQRPDRWCAVVAEVPFVDVVSTMFDPSIPLTVNEWEEWGDPRDPEQFGWLMAYSPYENPPPPGGRPDLLVTGALHDPRVMVWEPAKWVARLRETDPAWAARCLFRCETGAGAHAGPSGRVAHLAYEAEVHAWLLDRWGLAREA